MRHQLRPARAALILPVLAMILVAVLDIFIGLRLSKGSPGAAWGLYLVIALTPAIVVGIVWGTLQVVLVAIERVPLGVRLVRTRLGLGMIAAWVLLTVFFEWANLDLLDGPAISRKSYQPILLWALRLGIPVSLLVACLVGRSVTTWIGHPDRRVPKLIAGLLLLACTAAVLHANATLYVGLYEMVHLQMLVVAALLAQCSLLFITAASPMLDPSRDWLRSAVCLILALMIVATGMAVPHRHPAYRRTRAFIAAWNHGFAWFSIPGEKLLHAIVLPPTISTVDVSDVLDSLRGASPEELRERLDEILPTRRQFNVLWISPDTVRGDRCGFTGYTKNPTTVNLDRLAKDSFVFTKAYAAYPTSNYSYSAAFTSLFPRISPTYKHYKKLDTQFDPDTPIAGLLGRNGWTTIGISAFDRDTATRPDWFGSFRDGFQVYNPDQKAGASWAPDINASVIKSLKAHGKTPWFLWAHYLEPHAPYVPHEEFDFGDDAQDLYDGEIAYTDAKIGELLSDLERGGHLENTVIVCFSDHGEEFREHGALYHNNSVHEQQIRVPLLIYVPGLRGRRIDVAVNLVDLVPTFTELLGVSDGVRRMGRSLLPMMMGSGREMGFSYSEVFGWLAGEHARDQRALIIDHHKIITRPQQGTYEIYDLAKDPLERQSLVGKNDQLERRMVSLITDFDRKIDGYHRGSAAPSDPGTDYRTRVDKALAEITDAPTDKRSSKVTDVLKLLFTPYTDPTPQAARFLGEKGLLATMDRLTEMHAELPGAAGYAFIRTLGEWGNDHFVPFLKQLYSESGGYRRILIATSLARCGDTTAKKDLLGAVYNPKATMHQGIAIALARIGEPAGLPWLLHNLWEPNRPLLASTLRAARYLEMPGTVARVIRERFYGNFYMSYEVKQAFMDMVAGIDEPDVRLLLLRLANDRDSEIRSRARELLMEKMPAADVARNSEAMTEELAGDLAVKNRVYPLALVHYEKALSTGLLYNSSLRLRIARTQQQIGLVDAARTTLAHIVDHSNVALDREIASRRVGQLDSPIRIEGTRSFSIRIDPDRLEFVNQPRGYNAFMVRVPIKNTSSRDWQGGLWQFGITLEVLFESEEGELVPPRRLYKNWLDERGLDAGEERVLTLMGVAPPTLTNGRLVIRFSQDWLELPDNGIVFRHAKPISF